MILDLTVVAIDFGTHELTKLAIDQTLSCINPKEILVVSDKIFTQVLPGFLVNLSKTILCIMK